MVAKGWQEGGDEELLFNECGVSVWEEESSGDWAAQQCECT